MKNKFVGITLVLLVIFHLLNIAIWFENDLWPTGKDWHMHLAHSFTMSDNLRSDFSWENIVYVDTSHPSFFYLISLALRKICFDNNKSIFLTPALFFFLLIFSVYGLGKKLFDKQTGLIAAIICSFSPIIYLSSVQFHVDLAAAAMICLVNYLIVSSDGFRSFWFSLLTGLVLGLALLTRQFVILFVAGPFCAVLLEKLKSEDKKIPVFRQKSFLNSMIVMSVALIISLSYYYRPEVIASIVHRFNTPGEAGGGSVFTYRHLSYYLKGIIWQTGTFTSLIVVFGIYNLVKANNHKTAVLLSWFLLPLLVASFTQLKFIEYTMGYVPAIVLIALFGLNSIKHRSVKEALIIFWVVINLCQYFKEF
jgi:4-amino-4-deoxy-L-arabinose transferase-like glycosyltransferase